MYYSFCIQFTFLRCTIHYIFSFISTAVLFIMSSFTVVLFIMSLVYFPQLYYSLYIQFDFYRCTIHHIFSLICAAVLFIMWKNISDQHNLYKQFKVQKIILFPLFSPDFLCPFFLSKIRTLYKCRIN